MSVNNLFCKQIKLLSLNTFNLISDVGQVGGSMKMQKEHYYSMHSIIYWTVTLIISVINILKFIMI